MIGKISFLLSLLTISFSYSESFAQDGDHRICLERVHRAFDKLGIGDTTLSKVVKRYSNSGKKRFLGFRFEFNPEQCTGGVLMAKTDENCLFKKDHIFTKGSCRIPGVMNCTLFFCRRVPRPN